MLNALTIDVEDYFQVHAFSHIVRFDDWENYESRVERNTRRILDLLNGSLRTSPSIPISLNSKPDYQHSDFRNPIRATFFCLGWIAERYPHLIKEIYSQGHEIACHGYAHQLIYHQSPEEFRKDIRKAKAILENLTGNEVVGYRAPSYSITEKSLWALGILTEEGFKYDSSIFPIRHDFYGIPDAPRFPFWVSINGNGNPEFKPLDSLLNVGHRTLNLDPSISNFEHQSLNCEFQTPNAERCAHYSAIRNPRSLLEFPLSTVPLGKINFPLSGGGYFRLFPYPLIKKGLKRINEKENRPFIFYLHPWELDPDQPKIQEAGLKSKFRHYLNLNKTETRLKNLLADFHFSSIRDVLNKNERS